MSTGATAEKKLGFSGTVASVVLDAIRGLAALQVFGRHARNMFFVDYPNIAAHKSLFAVPYLLTSLGRPAILTFFVLSGFLIGGSVVRAVEAGTFHWGRYMTRRLTRLWIVLLPALLLTALWDHVGMASGHAYGLYHGGGVNLILPNVAASTTWKSFFGTLFFLQGIHTQQFGSATALWTLSIEFWYYVLFIMLALAVSSKTKTTMRVLYAAVFVAIAFFVGRFVMSMFPIWLFGAALLWIKPPRVGSRLRWAVTLPAFLAMCYLAKTPLFWGTAGDYCLGFVAAAWLWVQLSATTAANPHSASVRVARWFSRLAFTMYAIHEPILVVAAGLLLGDKRIQPTLPHIAEVAGVWLLVLGYIYLVASVTEFRTDAFRRWVDRLLGLEKRPQRSPHDIVLVGDDAGKPV